MSAGVVAALAAEARTVGRLRRRSDGLRAIADGTVIAVSGMGAAAAASAARALGEAGVTGLVSWGLAGGLDPALDAGTICLPTAVISSDGASFAADSRWRESVGAAVAEGHRIAQGTLLTHSRPIDDIVGKAAAFRATGALAVDMESLAVAEVAQRLGLPFLAVRVIVDTAADALPAAVLAASRGGEVRLLALLWGLIRSPWDILPLLRLARRYRAANRALVAVGRTGALASGGVASVGRRA